MTARRILVRVAGWDDPGFLGVVRTAFVGLETTHGDGPSRVAERVERTLHEDGYPGARVDMVASADDLLAGVERWVVRRESRHDPLVGLERWVVGRASRHDPLH